MDSVKNRDDVLKITYSMISVNDLLWNVYVYCNTASDYMYVRSSPSILSNSLNEKCSVVQLWKKIIKFVDFIYKIVYSN